MCCSTLHAFNVSNARLSCQKHTYIYHKDRANYLFLKQMTTPINLLFAVIDVFSPEALQVKSCKINIQITLLGLCNRATPSASVQFICSCATEDHYTCTTWTKQLTFFFIHLYGITACSINDCFSKISMLTLKEECSSSGLKGKTQVLPKQNSISAE